MPNSRRKGANGEREARDFLRAHGWECDRDGQQREHGHQDLLHNLVGFHIEVKRRETTAVDQWARQAERDAAPSGLIPVVMYRRSREPWRFIVPGTAFLAIVRELFELRAEVKRLRAGGWDD